MTVRDLITQLLDCNMDSEVLLCDDVEFEGEHGKMSGSVYGITKVDTSGYVFLRFDNRNHWKKWTEPCKDMGRYDPYTDSFVNDDCIRRQAAVEMVEGWWIGHTKDDDLATEIKKLPSVQPKAKTGHWINKMYDFKYCSAECDKCHQRALGFGSDNGWGYDYSFPDYCPNCGAKMESEDKE